MREILFRGKRVDNGEWVEGYLVCTENEEAYILDVPADFSYGDNGNRVRIGCFKKVDFSTVSQYTGFLYKNNQKIFEGDVVNNYEFKPGFNEIYKYRAVIVVEDGAFKERFLGAFKGRNFLLSVSVCNPSLYSLEYIGNIFDNPELWEE